MNGIEQIHEAQLRLNKASAQLGRFDMTMFSEMEVKFRLDTIINMILIVQSDLMAMEEEWTMEKV